jgi:peptide/nickel transport system substrate-binding protein
MRQASSLLRPAHSVIRSVIRTSIALAGMLVLGVSVGSGIAHAQKAGGILKVVQRENPPSLLLHEWATISASWPVMPLYSNLVLYNPDHAIEKGDDLVGELAEKWAWSRDGKTLTFTLRRGVIWHDGQPFTSADVKYNFDLIRDAVPDRKLRTSPRKGWYDQVESITTNGDFEVSFHLKRPQPSLLSMLGSGYSLVIPAHVDLATLRNSAVGTGPFKLKEYSPEQQLVEVKNPNYFIKDRPYLDGITYVIIKDRSARATALATGQVQVFFPQEGTPGIRDQVKSEFPNVVIKPVLQQVYYNLLINTKKPPFDNLKVRQAINYALDRAAFLKTQRGGTIAGGVLPPSPYSPWGLSPAELSKVPGWGDGAKDKALARKLLAEAGYGPGHPLQVKLSTRSPDVYQDMSVWAISELKAVGINASLDVVESALWFSRLARGDYELGANLTGVGAEDPDANLYENFSCASSRNYSFYCSKQADALIDQQSMERNPKKRMALVHEVDTLVQTDVARVMLGHGLDFMMYAPQVKGLVPHHSIYNYGRMQNVWLDK